VAAEFLGCSGSVEDREVCCADETRDMPVLGLLECLECSVDDALLCGLLAVVAVLMDESGLDLGCFCCCTSL